jgi:hypothetical protein
MGLKNKKLTGDCGELKNIIQVGITWMILRAGILRPAVCYEIGLEINATHRICSGRGAAGRASYARPIHEQMKTNCGAASNIMPPV